MGIISLKLTLSKILDQILRRPKDEVKSFDENRKTEEAVDRRDLGLRPVLLQQIVGSVGKYREFDSHFRLAEGHEPYRLKRIKEAMLEGKVLPPVELYKIKDAYYIVDGNHRVSAAREFGQKTIDAHIIEYLPSRKTLKNILYLEKFDFEKKTGLIDSITLTEVGKFAYLLEQIKQHQHALEDLTGDSVNLKNAAKDWYKTIYRPLITLIKRVGLIKKFPMRTPADLYVYVSYHHWQKGRKKRKYGLGLSQLIPNSMEEFRAQMLQKNTSDFPEMKQMAMAILLISVTAGREKRIMEKLFALKEVQEIYLIPGDFDIIAKIIVQRDLFSSDSEVIGQFVQDRVRRIQGVIKTQTIVPISGKQKERINI